MNKKILSFIVFAAIAVVAGWNVNQNKSEVALTDVAMENVEALAGETVVIYCRPAYIWVCNSSIPLYGEPIQL
jgi:hypothetical protein